MVVRSGWLKTRDPPRGQGPGLVTDPDRDQGLDPGAGIVPDPGPSHVQSPEEGLVPGSTSVGPSPDLDPDPDPDRRDLDVLDLHLMVKESDLRALNEMEHLTRGAEADPEVHPRVGQDHHQGKKNILQVKNP